MAGDDIVIRIRGLRSAFGEQVVHEDLDLDVYRGEIIGVVGGSGTGKSVLLKAIVGLGKPTAGHIEVFGQSVLDATEKQLKTLLELLCDKTFTPSPEIRTGSVARPTLLEKSGDSGGIQGTSMISIVKEKIILSPGLPQKPPVAY